MSEKYSNKTLRDDEYVQAYLKYESQVKAAKECGVSRETIARAVRRAGIELNGRKNVDGKHRGNGGGGSQVKITDDELIVESKDNTAFDIAKKHGMSLLRVERRLKRLGISAEVGISGRRNHYKDRCILYGCDYEEGITLPRIINKYSGICQLCGMPVNESDRKGNSIGKKYPTIDHIIPLSKGGSHTWGNVQLAHMACNSSKCDKITEKRKEVWT